MTCNFVIHSRALEIHFLLSILFQLYRLLTLGYKVQVEAPVLESSSDLVLSTKKACVHDDETECTPIFPSPCMFSSLKVINEVHK